MDIGTPVGKFAGSQTPQFQAEHNSFVLETTSDNTVIALRDIVVSSLENGIFQSALFHADKLVTLTGGLHRDVLLLCRAYVALGDHRQALDTLQKYGCIDDYSQDNDEFNSTYNGTSNSNKMQTNNGGFSPSRTQCSENNFLQRGSPFPEGAPSHPDFSFDGEYSFTEENIDPPPLKETGGGHLFSTKDRQFSNEEEASMEEVSGPPKSWACVVCTFLNPPESDCCSMCTTPGPTEEERMQPVKTMQPKSAMKTSRNIMGDESSSFAFSGNSSQTATPMGVRTTPHNMQQTPMQPSSAMNLNSPNLGSIPFPDPSPCSSVQAGGSGYDSLSRDKLDAVGRSSGMGVTGVRRLNMMETNNATSQFNSRLQPSFRTDLSLKLHLLAAQCMSLIGEDEDCIAILTKAVGGVHGAEHAASIAAREAKQHNAEYDLCNRTTIRGGEGIDDANVDQPHISEQQPNAFDTSDDDMMFSPPPRPTSLPSTSKAKTKVNKLSNIKEGKALDCNGGGSGSGSFGEEAAMDEDDIRLSSHRKSANVGFKKTIDLRASCCALLGMVLDKQSKSDVAMQWLANALRIDPYCVDAFEHILSRHLLKSDDEELLIEALPWKKHDDDWLKAFYATRVAPHRKVLNSTKKEASHFMANEAGGNLKDNSAFQNIKKKYDRFSHPALSKLLNGVKAPRDLTADEYECEVSSNFDHHDNSFDGEVPSSSRDLGDMLPPQPNVPLLAAKAELHWYNHEVTQALELSERAHMLEKLNEAPLLVYLASLVYLKMKPKLFLLSHHLVEAYPKKWVTWYAVGCYYFAVEKFEKAQRNFQKATRIDPRSAAAWIGCGHAYAALDESEQALGMYRSGGRMFIGSHLPLLYMGMEYLKTNNKNLSRSFLNASMKLCNEDPLVYNELGVLYYGEGRYSEAEHYFVRVLSLYHDDQINEDEEDRKNEGGNPLKSVSDYFAADSDFSRNINFGTILHPACFTALYNLGQTYRKQKRFNRSLKCLKAALSLEPRNGLLHGAIAFAHHLNGNLEEAASGYHVALSFDPNNILFSGLLSRIMMEVTNECYVYPSDVFGGGGGDSSSSQTRSSNHPYVSVAALEKDLGLTDNPAEERYSQDQPISAQGVSGHSSSQMNNTHQPAAIFRDGDVETWEQAALTSPARFLSTPSSPLSGEVNRSMNQSLSMCDSLDEDVDPNQEEEEEEESYDLDGDSNDQSLSTDMDL